MRESETWWQGAVIYHIYLRSFKDTSGDGIGDLPGIIEKLDYVASLGVDAIWVSPFQKSPMNDFGYDIEDYRAVDPMFGNLDDLKRLVDAAHSHGLKILMDQVLNHTSDQHPWFEESRSSRDNPKADWYVWVDPKPDGTPPNNWLSVFGGSSWQWDPRRNQYYLHNFLSSQPDLNYHNPDVQDAILDVCRSWYALGVDGFRLDVCTFYVHDPQFGDNPPSDHPPKGAHFNFNPYSYQKHVRDIAQPANLDFLERLRALSEEYGDRVLLGELHESEGVRLHKEYTSPGRLHLAYGYWLLGAHRLNGATIKAVVEELGHQTEDGWPCWALDNHDFIRAPSRLYQGEEHPDFTITILAALASLRGALSMYQGSELGLPNAEVPYDRLVDPYGREFYPAFKGRDGSRTPMPWHHDADHGGFSEVEPWLPIPDDHRDRAVDLQERTPGSALDRLRRFLHWRKTQPALRYGTLKFYEAPSDLLVFERRLDEEGVLCVFNLGDEEQSLPLAALPLGEALEGHGFDSTTRDATTLRLPPWGAYFGVLT